MYSVTILNKRGRLSNGGGRLKWGGTFCVNGVHSPSCTMETSGGDLQRSQGSFSSPNLTLDSTKQERITIEVLKCYRSSRSLPW